MSVIKTAISLPAGLFQKAAALAEEMEIPRSRLFSIAVKEFIETRRSAKMLARLNESWSEGLADLYPR